MRRSKKPCVSKLAEVGLHNAIPLPAPHLINSYDPAVTNQVLTKPIKFSNQNAIKGFFFIVVPCISIISRFFSPTNALFY